MLYNWTLNLPLIGAIGAVAAIAFVIGKSMYEDFWPTFLVSSFVFYPLLVAFLAAWIADVTGRQRLALAFAKVFAWIGGAIAAWYAVTIDFGKLPPVTILGCAVFVLGFAATGMLLGAVVDLLVRPHANPPKLP
jgi:hypothetical protein